MKKYRITKYKPWNRDNHGIYLVNEWTSYADIGKLYNGTIVTSKDYEYAEKKYIQGLKMILQDRKIDKLIICDLEKNFDIAEIVKLLNDNKLALSDSEEKIFQSIKTGSEVTTSDVESMTKLLLRECLWCRLISTNNDLVVEFGYDFYMYVYCDYLSKELINNIHMLQIFVEEI
jgi:hypothetical protein